MASRSAGGEQPGEEFGQRLEADRAGGTLQQQAEDLLHRHRGAKGRGRRRRLGRGDQRAQQRLLQRRAVEAGRMNRLLAAAGAPDALGKGRRAARRADQDRHVDGADVDAQFQRAAGKAERGVGLGELLLDLPAAVAFQVRVVDEDAAGQRASPPCARRWRRLPPRRACCRRPAPCASRGPGRWPGRRPARRLNPAASGSVSISRVAPAGHADYLCRGEVAGGRGGRFGQRRGERHVLDLVVGRVAAAARHGRAPGAGG